MWNVSRIRSVFVLSSVSYGGVAACSAAALPTFPFEFPFRKNFQVPHSVIPHCYRVCEMPHDTSLQLDITILHPQIYIGPGYLALIMIRKQFGCRHVTF